MTSAPPDLSRLRIDRSEPARPSSGGRGRGLAIGVILVLIALAALAWVRWAPRVRDVDAATASATGGGTASAAGISANGYVVARTKASVSAKVFGRLATLSVAEGSVVTRGAVIARLENDDYRAAVDAAAARRSQLEIERDQAARDLAREHHSLEAQVESAKAQLEVARANLENTLVRAPFDGTVLRKDAEVGEIVAPSAAGGGLTRTAIVTMADLHTLEVEVDVNEAYIAQVRNGQAARITLDAYPDTSFAGRVRQVVPTADRQKATVQVKVAILDRDPRILPEMGAKVVFVREEGAAVAAAPVRVMAPGAAVVQGPGGARVWVIVDGRVTARSVDVGPARGDQVEIRGGLSGGESLVLGAPPGLKDGTRVRVRGS
ncbi:MAG: efflux RND transporter periplasmic adaptor subunit [Candidatus Eisenbacteria bacterium]|uniref:Efflux RND transporter periplasmic adaptor subunit n=1 Tax=Eiseniibacteriota bacterium TaxID=2212470 RepID=A0A538U5J1_UNCEI|nr:MAG: efflux RND transporter periplasmic adaptor subunit [Candidatus Eisenbacteria bacterium]